MRIKPIATAALAVITLSGLTFGAGVAGVRLTGMTTPGDVLTWGLMVGLAVGWFGTQHVHRLMDWAHGVEQQLVFACPDPDCDVSITAIRQPGDRTTRLRVLAEDHTLHGRTRP